MEINDLLKQILHNQLIIMSYLETDNKIKCNQIQHDNKSNSLSLIASNSECELAKRLDINKLLKNAINDSEHIEKAI